MSNPSWRKPLIQALQRLQKPDRSPRIAFVGIGHELRGDDAAGVMLARAMQPLAASDRLLVIDAGSAPENCTGLLRRFRPDLVVLADAAQMDESPGTVRWLAWQDTAGLSASTHTLPLHVLASYLTADLGCDVALIGIQPAENAIDTSLSPVVQQAIDEVRRALAAVLPA
jgi:hydrogenase maturation protease HycI